MTHNGERAHRGAAPKEWRRVAQSDAKLARVLSWQSEDIQGLIDTVRDLQRRLVTLEMEYALLNNKFKALCEEWDYQTGG